MNMQSQQENNYLNNKEIDVSESCVVLISRDCYEILKDHTISCYPKEGCALLFGNIMNNNYLVKEVIRVPNRMRTLHKFGISRGEKIKAVAIAQYPIIGVYHSHAYESEPSPADIKGMEKTDNLWLIGYFKNSANKTGPFVIKAYCVNNSKMYNFRNGGTIMNLMQMPFARRAENKIRDVLIDELQTKKIDQIVDETFTQLSSINEEDVPLFRRYKYYITKIHTEVELKGEVGSFIRRLARDIDYHDNDPVEISGSIVCGGLCIGIIGSIIGGAVIWGVDKLFSDPEFDDCQQPPPVEQIGKKCFSFCLDPQTGVILDAVEVECPDSSSR
jgi:proteasome lid subunit RPN8/RPN11